MHPSQINVLSTEPRVLLAYGHGIETNLLDLLAIFVTNPEIAEALSAKTQHFITTLRTCFDEVSLLVAEASTLQQAKKSANQEDSIFSIIRANLREILNLIEPLYERLPKLKNHIQIVECLISNGLRTEEDRSRICLELRLAYEELLNCLILHFNCPLTEGMPIGDRVLFLKPHLTVCNVTLEVCVL
jgi:arginine deiminase